MGSRCRSHVAVSLRLRCFEESLIRFCLDLCGGTDKGNATPWKAVTVGAIARDLIPADSRSE